MHVKPKTCRLKSVLNWQLRVPESPALQPFFGWIQDLSARDPTSIFNLFGLIPWDPPTFLMIGVWPILMGVTMYLQQKLNPTPPDPMQAKIFMFLPIFITIILTADNAVIVGSIASNFVPKNRKQIILWGVIGAFVFKIFFAIFATFLFEFYFIKILGGLLLILSLIHI